MEEKILGFRLIKIDVLFFFFRWRPPKSDFISLTFNFYGSRLDVLFYVYVIF